MCSSSNEASCLWDCDISKYYNNSECVQCNPTCTKGCRRGSDCNLCNNVLCLKCSSFEPVCQECITDAKLKGQECECKSGFYLNENKCLPCNKICNECFGKANNCTTCYGEYLLRSGECLCPEGKYDLNFICYNCNLTCKSCLTEGSFSCLSCLNFKFFLII